MKILFLDTETTGLDSEKNDIVQIAGIIEIDGIVKEEFNLRCRPLHPDNIDNRALEVNGLTKANIMEYPANLLTIQQFHDICAKYVNKADKKDRLIPAGHFVRFDIDFIKKWYEKTETLEVPFFLDFCVLDLQNLCVFAQRQGLYTGKSLKLVDICKWLNVNLARAHDAAADIKATRDCFNKLAIKYKRWCK